MADKKISGLVSLAGVDLSDSDLFPVVDVSAGETKSISLSSLKTVFLAAANNIGTAGTAGFGVGICPAVPAGYTPLAGCTDRASANYGNYQYTDGSIMVWVPAFYFRLGHASNPTYGAYGVNSISVKPLSAYPDEATATAEGFYLHRAFVNGGINQLGFFRDKFDCSNNGGIASSIQGVQPLVSSPVAGQVGFNTLNGAPANAYYGAIKAARTRGAKFFPESVFIADALCRLSEAHAQASTATTYCAWYDSTGVRNYPKGNDNNALKSEADVLQNGAGAVTWTTAGNATYPAFALAGSANQIAKTTHNGQACGITDIAGNIFKINPGMTSVGGTVAIAGATKTNPVQITVNAHGRATGEAVLIASVGGMTQLNDKMFKVTVVDTNTLSLDGVDGTAFGTYTSGGAMYYARFYALKTSADIAIIGDGATLATDHWGAAGAAALFDEVSPNFATTYPNNGLLQRYGNGASVVFDMSTVSGRALSMMGMPAAGGASVSGSSQMGADYYQQHAVDQLCVMSRGAWNYGAGAGSRARYLSNTRSHANHFVGFAACRYL